MRIILCLLATIWFAVPCNASADTPTQVQKTLQAICDDNAAALMHKDLTGSVADLAPSFSTKGVDGNEAIFLQYQAGLANILAGSTPFGTLNEKIGPVTLRGNTVETALTFQNTISYPRTDKAEPYVYTHEYTQQTIWIKGVKGWQQTSAQVVRDVTTYSR